MPVLQLHTPLERLRGRIRILTFFSDMVGRFNNKKNHPADKTYNIT